MNDGIFWAIVVLIAVLLAFAYGGGISIENTRLEKKCFVEMQDKSFKEATEICKERVK